MRQLHLHANKQRLLAVTGWQKLGQATMVESFLKEWQRCATRPTMRWHQRVQHSSQNIGRKWQGDWHCPTGINKGTRPKVNDRLLSLIEKEHHSQAKALLQPTIWEGKRNKINWERNINKRSATLTIPQLMAMGYWQWLTTHHSQIKWAYPQESAAAAWKYS